jgi:hypothetical protein
VINSDEDIIFLVAPSFVVIFGVMVRIYNMLFLDCRKIDTQTFYQAGSQSMGICGLQVYERQLCDSGRPCTT